MLIFTLKVPVAIDLHFMNHQEPRFQQKISFTVILKKKEDAYILDDLRVSKLTTNFDFWVNYPFKYICYYHEDVQL